MRNPQGSSGPSLPAAPALTSVVLTSHWTFSGCINSFPKDVKTKLLRRKDFLSYVSQDLNILPVAVSF